MAVVAGGIARRRPDRRRTSRAGRFRQHVPGPPPLDTAMMTLDFVNGVTGTLATVRATPLYWRVHLFGTGGSAEVLDERTMILRKSGGEPRRTTYPAIDVLRAELD